MKIEPTSLQGVMLITPDVHGDERGFFMETYTKTAFERHGIDAEFVQWNHSMSGKNVLRGLHFQESHPQGKLVRVIRGEVFDVVVDIRPGSPDSGKWLGFTLSDRNKLQLFVPPGFAHGFCVTSDQAEFIYGCTDYYCPGGERGIIWNDPDIGVAWPVKDPILSAKDKKLPRLRDMARGGT